MTTSDFREWPDDECPALDVGPTPDDFDSAPWPTDDDDRGDTEITEDADEDDDAKRPRLAEILVAIADEQGAELWHDADDTAYASVVTRKGLEHWPVKGGGAFEKWLRGAAFKRSIAPSRQVMEDALATIMARAIYGGEEYEAPLRVGGNDEVIWLALAPGRVARIDRDGWCVLDADAPGAPRFVWRNAMRPLPEPEHGGRAADLCAHLNLPEHGWPMVATWIVCALRPGQSFPILDVEGEQGSGKSNATRAIRLLVDPSQVLLRSPPKDGEAIAVGCHNAWALAYDNLSTVSHDLADNLCRVATGGGFSGRARYFDKEENLIIMCRPVLLNGISGLTERPDLADRTMVVRLPPIPDDRRRPQDEIAAAFETARPGILGGFLDAVATAIRRLPEIKAAKRNLPRMADAMLWALAAAPSLDIEEDALYDAIMGGREAQSREVVANDPLGDAMLRRFPHPSSWQGTVGALQRELVDGATPLAARRLPQTPHALKPALVRITPGLRALGLHVTFDGKGRAGSRVRVWTDDPAEDRHDRHDRHEGPAEGVSSPIPGDVRRDDVRSECHPHRHAGDVGDDVRSERHAQRHTKTSPQGAVATRGDDGDIRDVLPQTLPGRDATAGGSTIDLKTIPGMPPGSVSTDVKDGGTWHAVAADGSMEPLGPETVEFMREHRLLGKALA